MKALAFGLGLDVARRRKLSRYAFLARQVDPCDTAQHIVLRRDRPFARRDTCTTGSQPHSRYALENPAIDVSESFTYIARGAIYLVTDKLRDIRIKFGFVVEGRERDERCINQNLRRLLDGVAVWVLHPSIQSSRPRRRRELTG